MDGQFVLPALPAAELSQTKLTNVPSLRYLNEFSSPMSETPIHKSVCEPTLSPLNTVEKK